MKKNRLPQTTHYTLLTIVFILVLVLPNFSFGEEDLEESCLILGEKGCQNLGATECRKELEKCEEYYREQSEKIEADITKTAQEKKTLQNKIYTLNRKIQNLTYQIYQSNLIIKDLGIQVEDTEASIEKTSLKIEDSKEKLANILRNIYEEDQKAIIEILLSETEISDFFNNLVALEALNSRSKDLLQNIKILKSNLEKQKISLDEEKGDLEQMVKIQTLQKEESTKTKGEQEYYLGLTEEQYQRQLKEEQETEKKAAKIAARLFELVGIAEAPTFGEAIKIAESAASVVNIRPAFLLAIISKESAIGRNVGQCYVTNKITGEGIYKNGNPVSRIMHPTRDLPIFLEITGDNFSQTPISCWIKNCVTIYNGQYYFCGASVDAQGNIHCFKNGYIPFGWGGAMGPAQFIPSTWRLYEDKIKRYTGNNSPNPWNIRESFIASAVYLSDLGASAQTKQKEMTAASRYYGGSYSYARDVAKRADCIQDFMDKGTMSSWCEGLIF